MTRITKGIAIYPDKRVQEVELDGLDSMQEIVGGLIEAVGLSFGTLYVNEEYTYKFGADEFNSIAADVAGLGGRQDLMMQGILGPGVLVGGVDHEGWDTDVTEVGRKAVRRVGREAGMVPADFGLKSA